MKQLTSFEEASRYLDRFYRNARTEYKLDNMYRIMELLGNPQEQFQTVHIAGTSGKTSTAYYMSALLAASGKKTGLTVSPHVDEINERLQINGQPVEEPVFCRVLTEFLTLLEGFRLEQEPSWFEVMIAFAYWYFAREQVDYVVAEVGLGGLKDGTNVIERADKVCIITDIGYDHMQILGDTLPEIARQKIGIVRQGNLVVSYPQTTEIREVFETAAVRSGARLYIVPEPQTWPDGMPAYQYRNWELACETYRYLSERDGLKHLTSQELAQTRQLQVPGRMDRLTAGSKTIVMDGAHNAQKAATFVDSFQKLYPSVRPPVLLALRQGKEYQAFVPLLQKLTDHVIITTFHIHQDLPVESMNPDVLAEALRQAGVASVAVIPDQHEAFQALLETPGDIAVVTGSLYMLNQIRHNEHLV